MPFARSARPLAHPLTRIVVALITLVIVGSLGPASATGTEHQTPATPASPTEPTRDGALPEPSSPGPGGSPAPRPDSSPPPSQRPEPDWPTITAAAGDTIVSYRSSGYRYQVVARGAGTGFETVGFDDTTWATGTAAFGSGGSCSLQGTVATTWPANTDILVRRRVSLPAGTTALSVSVAIDNDIQVYWNGTLVGSSVHENCPALDRFTYPVSDSLLVAGDNILAVRGIDRGDQSLLDITVRASLPLAIPASRFAGPGASPHQNDPTGRQAEPVNTNSGNYTTTITDLTLPGRGLAFAFSRTYNSIRAGDSGPLGPGWSHSYGVALRPAPDGTVTFLSEDGSSIPFAPDGTGGFGADAGVLSTLASVAGGGYRLTRRDGVRYTFDASGQVTSLADRNANTLAFSYTGTDLTTITDTVGRTITLQVDPGGRITSVSDPGGRSVQFAYDAVGRLASVTDVRGGATLYGYDAANRLATITDQNGNVVVTNTYDATGRVVRQLDARGFLTTFAYDAAGGATTMTDARGGTWVDSYAGPTLVARADSLGNTTRFGYDSAYNRTTVTSSRGFTTTMSYDARGNLLTRQPLLHSRISRRGRTTRSTSR